MESFSYSMPPIRILVVDDDASIRQLLSKCLTSWGYFVSLASDGGEAIELFDKSPFDIVITDISMPQLDGLELIRRIRSSYYNVDIIAMTGFLKKYRYADVIAAGASDFLSKPFGIDELEAKITRIMRDREERTRMAEQIFKDALTGLMNRLAMDHVLKREFIRASRYNYPISILFVDIDHFKELNDRRGHLEGDRLLKNLAKIFETSIRKEIDFAFRFGGDEFVILLVYIGLAEAQEIALRIIRKYENQSDGITSLSVGVISGSPAPGSCNGNLELTIKEWLDKADKALYEAKKVAGNHVVALSV